MAIGSLTSGNTTSCGCLHREGLAARNRTHGMSRTPEYEVWQAMIARCHRPGATFYELYGGRGITVCDAWREPFEAFIADVGRRPSAAHEIDRIDNDGNYEPGNVRWATRTQQARNTRRNRVLAHDGRTLTLVEWSAETGIAAELIRARIDRLGWSVSDALSRPSRGGGGVKQKEVTT